MTAENIITLIATWEEDFGTRMVEIYPEGKKLDFNTIASHIFITYNNFYKKTDIPSRLLFKLPLVNINKKSSVFLDGIPSERSESTFRLIIVVFLFPDYIADESLNIFDNLIQNIGMEYVETKSRLLEKYYNQINEKFILEQTVQDSEVFIDDNYSIENALLDFKTGLEQYQKQELDSSYFLLRKAHQKFEIDDQLKLLLETYFFIGTILMKKNKFKVAGDYFEKLESLAHQLQHQKYYEKSIFMEGYCDYQGGDYNEAYKKFSKLGETGLTHVSKFQYCTLLGKVLADAGHFDDAIKSLEKALEISESAKTQPEVSKKRADIFLDLGHISYERVYQAIKSGNRDSNASSVYLTNSNEYFEETIKIWKLFDNYSGLIEVYQLIASNYESLKEPRKAIENYEKALEYAELSNDLVNRFNLLEKIIQMYAGLELHEYIVKKIDVILHEVAPVAYLDLFTVAGFHTQLGASFVELERHNEALSELIVALNLYNKFPDPTPELLKVYDIIIKIYQEKDNAERTQYYKDKRNIIQVDLEEASKQKVIKHDPLDIVEEFWIFTKDGTVIFSYTPKTNTTPRLLSGFLIAMDSFGSELQLDKIKTIKIGFEYFAYYKEEDHSVFIVGRANVKYSVDFIERVIKSIYMKFWITYDKLIETFDGDITKFDPFIKKLKDLDID